MKIWPQVDFAAKMLHNHDGIEYIAASQTILRKQGPDGKWYKLYIYRDTRTTKSFEDILSIHVNDFIGNVYRHMLGWIPIPGDKYWGVLDEDQRTEEERLGIPKPSDPAAV